MELIEAYGALDDRAKSDVEMDFAGGFESEPQKLAFLEKISGFAQVRYHGTVHGERKRQLFAAAHVFCLPTYYAYEGQPISIY